MPRWIPQFLICIFLYSISVYVVGRLAEVLAYFLAKSGSVALWQLLHEHPFVRSFLVGLIAGLVPFRTWIAASGVFNPRFARTLKRLNPDLLKPWVFLYLSPVFVMALLRWTMQWHENRRLSTSVLQTISAYPLSEFFKGFLATNCSSGGESAFFWRDEYGLGCMKHMASIAIWLTAIGYSLAPAARKQVLPLFKTERPTLVEGPSDEDLQGSTITEKTDTK
jgi:hypothetical protein